MEMLALVRLSALESGRMTSDMIEKVRLSKWEAKGQLLHAGIPRHCEDLRSWRPRLADPLSGIVEALVGLVLQVGSISCSFPFMPISHSLEQVSCKPYPIWVELSIHYSQGIPHERT